MPIQTRPIIMLTGIVPSTYCGQRLDYTLANLFPDYSRETLKKWILDGSCLVDTKIQTPKFKLKGGEHIEINANILPHNLNYIPENLPIHCIYEDPEILVINKPSNLVVHPGAGNWDGTLLNRLLHYLPELEYVPRAGIVHRLDQDTSGLMVIAKNLPAYNNLIMQFKNRSVIKIYEAIVQGNLTTPGTINAPIGRNRKSRLKMQVTNNGKPAVTHYRILQQFTHHSHIRITLETGRTHQIRVHMEYIKHPILGDKLYLKHRNINYTVAICTRQILHAKELIFNHPSNAKPMHFIVDLPEDFQQILKLLSVDANYN